jgi:hypothetical protein
LKERVGNAPGRDASLASVAAKIDRWSWDDVFELGPRSLLAGRSQARPLQARPGDFRARADHDDPADNTP